MKKNTTGITYHSLIDLKLVLEKYAFNSIVLISGKVSFQHPLVQKYLIPTVQEYPHIHWNDFLKNPEIDDLLKGIEKTKHLQNPLYIAIGGGSVLDMAKLVLFFNAHQMNPKDYFLKRVSKTSLSSLPPLIAIPTTAGTGSETTQFATLYIDKKKYSLDNACILPSEAILDPMLTLDLPPKITAESGADALSQAIESYWSVASTYNSRAYARKAIELIYPHLYAACHTPNLENREKMLAGAYYAGKAIQITRTTAPHAISYPLTSYFGVAHGQAVSLTLPYFFEFNSKISDATSADLRGSAYVQQSLLEICKLLNAHNPEEASENLRNLFKSINLKTKFNELGISEKDHRIILDNGFTPSRMNNNPRTVKPDDVSDILRLLQNE